MTLKASLKIISQFCLLGLIANTALAEDLSAYWLTVNTPKIALGSDNSTKSHFELRFDDDDSFNYYRFSQKFYTKLGENWTLGTHPVIESKKKSGDWTNGYRFDIELNPKKITLFKDGPKLSLRNRWELRWKEGKGSEIFHRIRQSSKLSWKLKSGPFNSYTLANEAFYETDKGRLTMNRFYPAMLSTKVNDSVKATFYLLYQSKRSGTTSNWKGAYYLGTSLSF